MIRSNAFETRLTVAAFFGLLLVPWLAGVAGSRPTTVDNRPLGSFPEFGPAAVSDGSFFSALDTFVLDHMPLRQRLAGDWSTAQYAATGWSPAENVFIGTDGTLFLSQDFLSACEFEYDPTTVTDRVSQWDALAADRGAAVMLVIAPDKGAIRTDLYSGRAGLARDCSERRRSEWTAGMVGARAFLPLWDELRVAQAGQDASLYYHYDSHWTFEGAGVFARLLVDRLQPGIWDPDDVVEREVQSVKADIARRLGWSRIEDRPVLASERADVRTDFDERDVDGVRTVRRYRSTSETASLIPGSTIVLHDSMMNFAELQLAPYFEDVTFVHWRDVDASGFFDLVAEADRLVIEVVERSSHIEATRFFLDPTIDARMREALRADD